MVVFICCVYLSPQVNSEKLEAGNSCIFLKRNNLTVGLVFRLAPRGSKGECLQETEKVPEHPLHLESHSLVWLLLSFTLNEDQLTFR